MITLINKGSRILCDIYEFQRICLEIQWNNSDYLSQKAKIQFFFKRKSRPNNCMNQELQVYNLNAVSRTLDKFTSSLKNQRESNLNML